MAKKILVADDEEDLVKLLTAHLSRWGYQVVTAVDGAEALRKAREEKPDLILLDLMLPKMDGYKVCGLLKRDTRYSRIPIILFTARAQEADEQLGLECGADAYLKKPFESQTLLTKIQEVLRK